MNLVAVDKTGSSVCLIDAETLDVLKRLPMPIASHDLAQDPRDGRIYVSIYGGGTYGENPEPGHEIVVVDPDAFKVIDSIDLSPYTSPHGLAFDQDGVLWSTCDAFSCLLAIQPRTRSVIRTAGTKSAGTHWVLASIFTGYLYTSNKQDHFVSVIDPRRSALIGTIEVPNGSEGICFSPDGRLLYVADHRAPRILVLDVVAMVVEQTIALDEVARLLHEDVTRTTHHMRVCVSGDGSTIAVAAYHFNRLVLIHTANPSRQVTLTTGKGPIAMAFRPDDPTRLYFSNHDAGTLGVVDTQSGQLIRTANCNGGIESMRFL